MISGQERNIFGSLFKEDDFVGRRKHELIANFSNQNVFSDEYYVFFLLIKDFVRISPTKEFISLYLKTNRAILSKSGNIDIAKYTISDVDPFVEFGNSCITLFEELSALEVEEKDFYLAIEMHKMHYIEMQSIEILEESTTILTEGVNQGYKQLSGYQDMRSNINTKFKKLDNILNKSDRKGLITFGKDDTENDEDDKLKLVSPYGIAPLDEALGGMYEGDMISLLAPSKGGKSRVATYLIHTGAVQYGVNCLMWSIENGVAGWKSLIRARHFNYLHNSKITDATQKKFIDSDMIRKGTLEGELKDLEAASWTDLKNNQNYGTISMIDEDFDLDTFIDILDEKLDVTGAKIVCVDYLQLISAQGRRINKNERISEAYIKMLQFLKRRKVVGICPAQFKQNVVGELSAKSKDEIMNMELRDSAGESYEVIKTPDVNLGLYATPEELRNGFMQIISIPSRNSKPFEPISLYADLGTCTLVPLKESA